MGAFSGERGPGARELRGKLALLTRSVPGLTVVWTPSASASVELFEVSPVPCPLLLGSKGKGKLKELKWGKPEPESEEAAGKLADESAKDKGGSVTVAAMLDALPGLTAAERDVLTSSSWSLRMPYWKALKELKRECGSWADVCKLKKGDSGGKFDRVVEFLAKDFR